MSTSRRRWVRRSKQEQQQIVEQCEASGLSTKHFCQREAVSLSSLQRWRQRTARSRQAGFVELVSSPRSEPAAASWSVEIVLAGGTCLRLRE